MKSSTSRYEQGPEPELRKDRTSAAARGVVVRQRGSHIRMHKWLPGETLKLTVPAHRPVKRSTLAHILAQARIELERLLELL